MRTSARCKVPGCSSDQPCNTCWLIAFWQHKQASGDWTRPVLEWRSAKGKS